MEKDDFIHKVFEKIDELIQKQSEIQKEINHIQNDILEYKLRQQKNEKQGIKSQIQSEIPAPQKETNPVGSSNQTTIDIEKTKNPVKTNTIQPQKHHAQKPAKPKFNIEQFIGENLINKIGILITIIGVAIGVKYAVDHDLVSPVFRIVGGYIVAIAFLGVSFYLKKKYKGFSAVLLSGAMAIFYLTTFAAYDFYSLYPKFLAFFIMLLFTVLTVIAAIKYDQQVIAHFGLVGAYAVPFLLSDGTGKIMTLFIYMTILNFGILVLAMKKYWKPLYYSSFIFTWLIYIVWFGFKFNESNDFNLALTFLFVFFFTFYGVFILNKFINREVFLKHDVFLVLSNSFLFYGLGFYLFYNYSENLNTLSLFTFINAIIHALVALLVSKRKKSDKNLMRLLIGLSIVFVTLTIPVQLSGKWVTLFWIGEAAVLFFIGRKYRVSFYEFFSYPLMILAFGSLIHDWIEMYSSYKDIADGSAAPILNLSFLSTLVFSAFLGIINYINLQHKPLEKLQYLSNIYRFMKFVIPGVFIFVLFFLFKNEIALFWNQKIAAVQPDQQDWTNGSIIKQLNLYKTLWTIVYMIVFSIVLSLVNFQRLKKPQLANINFILNIFTIVVFLTVGFFSLHELRDLYLSGNTTAGNYPLIHVFPLRYLSYILLAGLLYVTYQYKTKDFITIKTSLTIDFVLHGTILWVASAELIHWLDIYHPEKTYKLSMSIIWALYALFLIAIGIAQQKKYLRISAVALFGITLIKLFFYDISHLSTLAKTIIFIIIGILLLISSFLYNKYKDKIFDFEEEDTQ